MTRRDLVEFIENGMRMSHIYQPVMLIELLNNHGRATDKDIAKALLSHDESQIEYYTHITNTMPGRILRKRGIVERDNKSRTFSLSGYEDLKEYQIQDLIEQLL